MALTVTLRLDAAALQALTTSASGAVQTDLRRRANRVLNRARQLCPVDYGNLRASLHSEPVKDDRGHPAFRVGTNVYYARWVHDGTGVYAGRGYIYPRHARLLAWERPAGTWHFARRVKGMKGRPFLTAALAAAK